VADSKTYAPPHVFLVKFGSSPTKSVHMNRKEPLKLGSAGTPGRLFGVGVADHLKTNPLRICVITSYLVVLRQRVYCTVYA